jgi:hypothetical protein
MKSIYTLFLLVGVMSLIFSSFDEITVRKGIAYLRNSVFSQRCMQRYKSSGIKHYVNGEVLPLLFEGIMMPRNVGNYLPNDTA